MTAKHDKNGRDPPRRDFLKGAGAMAAVAAALGTGVTLAGEGAAGANDRIGVGFIGTGGRCGAHINIVNQLKTEGRAEPVAVCDVYRPAGAGRGGEDRWQDLWQPRRAAGRPERRRRLHRHARPPPRPAGDRRGASGQGRLRREAADPLVAVRPGQAARRRGARSTGGSSRWARSTWPTTPTARSAS